VLERIFLLERLAPWHNNRLSRLVKTPKLHMGDTGLACALMGIDAATLLKERERLGPLLETFVLQELRRQASWRPDPIEFFHYRDRDDFEVDIVLEFGSTAVAGVEVKAAATVVESDFRGLPKLREAAGQRFRSGVVFYDGNGKREFWGRVIRGAAPACMGVAMRHDLLTDRPSLCGATYVQAGGGK
jgi:predicted AAA+ superfamily ATPase